jgi:hypothetical protein
MMWVLCKKKWKRNELIRVSVCTGKVLNFYWLKIVKIYQLRLGLQCMCF